MQYVVHDRVGFSLEKQAQEDVLHDLSPFFQ
jgi:hypothetical protein